VIEVNFSGCIQERVCKGMGLEKAVIVESCIRAHGTYLAALPVCDPS
jgi:hypothetical protein